MSKVIVTVAEADTEADVFMALLEIGHMHRDKTLGDALIEMLRPHFDTVKAVSDG